jgi:hypothetical protein
MAGGTVVYLGGPRGRKGPAGPAPIQLHDPPPGYRPRRMPLKYRQRKARQDWVLMRIATVVLILAGVAFLVIILVIIATYS